MILIGGKNLNLIDKRELRKFGLVVSLILTIIGVISILKGRELNLSLIAISAVLCLLALIMPNLLSPVYKVWMKIGNVLGRITSFLILSIIFYLIVMPIGLIYRMFNTNSKKFAYKSGTNSYWVKKPQSNPKEYMKRLF